MSTPRARTRTARPKADAAARGARPFRSPSSSLEALDAGDAASLINASSDIALVIDRRGVIEDMAASIDDLPSEIYAGWIGRRWSDVVTPESREKVQALLHDASEPQKRRMRHVNHPVAAGVDFPVMYSAVPMGRQGRVVALGRDMRALARLQQRLVEAQHALERDYWRLRNVETRYRLLFDQASEAIVIAEAGTRKVLEANPAVKEVLGVEPRRLVGQTFPLGLPDRAQRELGALLDRVHASGRSEEVSLRTTAPRRLELQVAASLFVQDDRPLLLVRLRTQGKPGAAAATGRQALSQIVERAPDGFVVTDTDGRIVMANAAFVGLTQLASEDQLRGESIDRWLGRPGVDLNVMLATLRQQGSLRLFATTMHGQHGADDEVEISGVAVPDADPPCLGFTVRHVGRRLGADPAAGKSAPRSVEQLTQLVGRMPLKDLVRESTDLIERLCIEAALQLTQGNRASAAEMLGLSRQSLYVKLRRYGISDAGADAD